MFHDIMQVTFFINKKLFIKISFIAQNNQICTMTYTIGFIAKYEWYN